MSVTRWLPPIASALVLLGPSGAPARAEPGRQAAPAAQSVPPRPAPGVKIVSRGKTTEIMFAFDHRVRFGLQRTGGAVALRFPGGGDIPGAGGGAAIAVRGGTDRADIVMPEAAAVRTGRLGNNIVLLVQADTMAAPPSPPDPAGKTPATVAPPPVAPPPVAPAPLASAMPPGPPDAPDKPAASPAQPPPQPASQPGTPAGPRPLLAMQADPLEAADAESDVNLTFGSQTGAATFRRNGVAWIVFDERRPLDLAALQDSPLFAHAALQLLQAATVLRLPLEAGRELHMTHAGTIWTVSASAPAVVPAAIGAVIKPTRLELPAAEPSQVVVVPDPDTGQNLLVGTLRGAPSGVPVARAMPAFILQPTWQGVLVEPISDAIAMRTTADGFAVDAGGEALSSIPESTKALAEGAFMTRRFEIPSGPADMLMRRLQAQVEQAGAAPPQARAKPRKAAAATLIALGLGVEAQAMMNLAAEEDPRLITDPDAAGLAAIAAMLGGRGAEADGIGDPALSGSDEVALWRAVHAAQTHEGAPDAAAVFATTAKLLLAYPARLRDALLPLAAETMALGGAPDAADALLAAAKDNPALDLARAIRMEQKPDPAAALAQYDTLAVGRDRLIAARAASRATLLRLATHAITPAAAAAALEGQFLNWRGDGRELDLRLRAAALETEAGAWRPAFALLRETAAMYPDNAPMIQARMADLMAALVSGPASASISPLELVTLTEENAELVAAVAPAKAAGLMADKLMALDLPQRAGPVIERMMRAAPIGVPQATLGARLAALHLAEGDDAGAQAALANSNAPGLPAPLVERRSFIAARLAAHAGHTVRAANILTAINTPGADDLRATLLSSAQDWHGAADALAALAAKTVPLDGPITATQQDTILRLASALSRAGDSSALRVLAAQEGSRMDGPRAGMFHLLTAAPVAGVGDLARSSSEMSLAKAIPAGLGAIGAR